MSVEGRKKLNVASRGSQGFKVVLHRLWALPKRVPKPPKPLSARGVHTLQADFDPMITIGGAPSGAPGAHSKAVADHGPDVGHVPQTPTRPPSAARLKTTPVARRKLPTAGAPADVLEGAHAILFAPAADAVPEGATSAHRPPLDPGSSVAVAPPAPFAAQTPSGTHAETTTAHSPASAPSQASVPAPSANPPLALTPPSTPHRKRHLHPGGTVSQPAPPAPKRPKHIAKPGPIEVTRAEMEPLARALQRQRGRPDDDVNALVGATVGYLLATPLAYRSLVYGSVAM